MNEVEELQGLESACRLCLTTEETRSSIFGATQTLDPLIDKIQNCLSLQIAEDDKLSTLICITCVNKVNQWHQYKKTCLQSQDRLLQWLAKQSEPLPVVTVKQEPEEATEQLSEKAPEKLPEEETNAEPITSPEDSVPKIVENSIESTKDAEKQKELIENGEPEIEVPVAEVPEKSASDVPDTNPETEKDSAAITEPEAETEKQMEVEPEKPSEMKETAKRKLSKDSGSDPKRFNALPIKSEPMDENEMILDSDTISNSLDTTNEENAPESNSTDKMIKGSLSLKTTRKKIRRGPHTHFRGTKIFKRKCMHCQINLHSKTSYAKHMARFHSIGSQPGRIPGSVSKSDSFAEETEEMIEDVEEELENLEEEAPLTPVQQNIISQLKTFTCYSCEQSFQDRRSTLNHIRQHMPDLRAYTCVACLTEFADQNTYKQHCEASFECAMKIALVVPIQGTEKYFTCSMCLRPMSNRKELLSHLSKHSDKQYEELMSPVRPPPKLTPMAPVSPVKSPTSSLPYGMGDPAYNHECDLCGMIYRYKPNMIKHRELCASLQPEGRTSYKCIDCGMTFLVFSKFHTHVTVEHKKKELKCPKCAAKFRSPSDYLTHHEFHRKKNNFRDQAWNQDEFLCSLCNLNFPNKAELVEHKNLHLKVKIYSCVICRSMFSSAGALEVHMKDHGIDDPKERTANSSCMEYGQEENTGTANSSPSLRKNECAECGKTFSNTANLKRHIRNAHGEERRIECSECKRNFKNKESYDEHIRISHNSPEKMVLVCPECPKTFVFQANLDLHIRNVHTHKEKHSHECEICGKTFAEEASLKIHRGWHNRANSRFSLGKYDPPENSVPSVSKPAKARKSFPTPSVYQQSVIELQCQVCDDKFVDVSDLRKHVWDVHCARTSKPEKLKHEFHCGVCSSVFPDQSTLEAHMEWHEGSQPPKEPSTFRCDICDKYYSSRKVLWRHKKLHKVSQVVKFQSVPMKKPSCNFCGRSFAAESALKRHKAMSPECQGYTARPLNQAPISEDPARKKPVTCHICKTVFPSMSILYQHKQLDHKTLIRERNPSECIPVTSVEGVRCNVCGKHFSGITNLKQHFTIKHKDVSKHPCTVANCNLVFSTPHALKNHELQHSNMIYSCTMCERHFFQKSIIDKHIYSTHRAVYQSIGPDKESLYKETDLTTYTVKGANGTVCPRCKIKYPNIKAMKIHYFKFHDNFA